jgi:hypothetical protein
MYNFNLIRALRDATFWITFAPLFLCQFIGFAIWAISYFNRNKLIDKKLIRLFIFPVLIYIILFNLFLIPYTINKLASNNLTLLKFSLIFIILLISILFIIGFSFYMKNEKEKEKSIFDIDGIKLMMPALSIALLIDIPLLAILLLFSLIFVLIWAFTGGYSRR